MNYYQNVRLIIRDTRMEDAQAISAAERAMEYGALRSDDGLNLCLVKNLTQRTGE